jgi:cytochrome P450
MLDELGGVDLTDLDNFALGFPHDVFARHRRVAPVLWHEPTSHTPDGEGFWSVATHAEAVAVMHDPDTYSSERGGHRAYGGTLLPDMATAGRVLNMMDDPRHQRIRMLVNRGFTPRMIGRLDDELRRRTNLLVDAIADDGECDFVTAIAGELPMQAICILMGIPEADRHMLFEWTEPLFDFRNRDAYEPTPEVRAAQLEMHRYGTELLAEKRRNPAEDMLSVVVHAEMTDVDPPRLSDEELYSFFSLLFAAGSDTTRNATAGGLLALLEAPDELAALTADRSLLPTAVEEMVRWTAPAAYNRRTATRDTVLGGRSIAAGDKVVFWEASANRDERVFAESMRFRVARNPNPHLGFGHGIHHCLGANLARLEMRVTLEVLLDRLEGFALAGAPEFGRNNKHNVVRHLPIRYRRSATRAGATP